MMMEKGLASRLSSLSASDMEAIMRAAHKERALVFSGLVSRAVKALGRFFLGAEHSLLSLEGPKWPDEIPFHDPNALGVTASIPSKADKDAFFGDANPVLPFAALNAGMVAAQTPESKIAA